uniref:Testis expressed 12 n=1 Tax=Equus caballus TaxID=9796 RepID=F7CKW0_HORSE
MMASHLVKPDARNCKRTRELESQMPDSPQLSSLGKSDSSFSESSGLFYKDEALEKDLNDMSKEINLMLSTYAKILRQVLIILFSLSLRNTVMHCLMRRVCSEKYIIRRFCHCVNVLECIYTNLDGMVYYTARPYGTNLTGSPLYMWSTVH